MQHRPRICVSLEPTWIHALGASRFTYQRLISRAGGVPRRVKCPADLSSSDILSYAQETIDHADGLLLGGGSDISIPPDAAVRFPGGSIRDQFELALVDRAFARRVPILGICRGCQLLNVARGGSLKTLRDARIRRRHRSLFKHPVVFRRGSRLAAILGHRLSGVRSLHRLAVSMPGDGLCVTGRAADSVAEAIEDNPESSAMGWCVGLQWHPELTAGRNLDQPLIEEFVRQAQDQSRSGT